MHSLQLALLLISQNALIGKTKSMIGIDPTEQTLAHDVMMGHLIAQFPSLHGQCHSIEISLSFTSEMMTEDDDSNN